MAILSNRLGFTAQTPRRCFFMALRLSVFAVMFCLLFSDYTFDLTPNPSPGGEGGGRSF